MNTQICTHVNLVNSESQFPWQKWSHLVYHFSKSGVVKIAWQLHPLQIHIVSDNETSDEDRTQCSLLWFRSFRELLSRLMDAQMLKESGHRQMIGEDPDS